jgi:integrase
VNENKFPFTDERLSQKLTAKHLPEPGKRQRYFDTNMPGLCARITSDGTLTFKVYRWFSHMAKPLDITLGRWPDISIKQARKLASDKLLEITKGRNPNASKRAERGELTLDALFSAVKEEHIKVDCAKSTQLDYGRTYNKHLAAWGGRRLSEITADHVKALRAKIYKASGLYAANNALRLLRLLYNQAKDYGYHGENPSKIKLFATKARERVPEGEEVKRLLQAINQEPNQNSRDILLLLIYTGQRKCDVCAMRWAEVDFDAKEWRFTIRKNQEPQRLPLIPAAVSLLEKRRGDDPELVFPGSSNYLNLKRAWARVLERGKLENLRMHDLRRFHGSMLVRTGASLVLVQKALGHKSYQSTSIYARLDTDPVRAAMEKAADDIFIKAELSGSGVVKLQPKRRKRKVRA